MALETEDLSTHVSLCQLRYQALESKIDAVEERLSKVENEVSALKKQVNEGFTEIKVMLERQNTRKQTQWIATFGTVITALLGLIGYIVVKIN